MDGLPFAVGIFDMVRSVSGVIAERSTIKSLVELSCGADENYVFVSCSLVTFQRRFPQALINSHFLH